MKCHEHSKFHELFWILWGVVASASSKKDSTDPCFAGSWTPSKCQSQRLVRTEENCRNHGCSQVPKWARLTPNRERNDSWLYIQLWVMSHIHMSSWLNSNSLHIYIYIYLSLSISLSLHRPLGEFSIFLKVSLPTSRNQHLCWVVSWLRFRFAVA